MIARFRARMAAVSAREFALLTIVVLLIVHGLLLGVSLQRMRTANALRAQTENLLANLEQMSEVETETIAELERQLQDRELRIDNLEAAMPALEGPYPIYTRAYSSAQSEGLELISVTRMDPGTQPTQEGSVEVQIHAVDADGDLQACLAMLQRLEADGGITLATDRISMDPASEACEFQVLTVYQNQPAEPGQREGAE